ncbi:MAG: LysM peptidoglycan-binding domain-containing protein [Pseudomonadota bacterium]
MVVTVGTGLGFAAKATVVAISVTPIVMSPTNAPVQIVPETTPQIIEPDLVPDVQAPTITLVRIDQFGTAVIGGRAEPGVSLRAIFADEPITASRAEPSGDFVIITDLPVLPEPAELIIVSLDKDGSERARSAPVLVLGRESAEDAPQLVVVDETGAEVVEATPATAQDDAPKMAELSLDTITYEDAETVTFGGRGALSRSVQVYLDNEAVDLQPVSSSGLWEVRLPDIDEGIYTLRIDELNAEGEVTGRVESPFKKARPDLEPGQVVVQPGNTLWALAADQFGQGERYVVIFDANKDLIRDPDLIYPGQIFVIPGQ